MLCLINCTYFGAQHAEAQQNVAAPLQNINQQAQNPRSAQKLQLTNVQVSSEGFVISINGIPQMSTLRTVSPDRIILDLQATEISGWRQNSILPVNRYGVRQIRVEQLQKSPAIARLVFDLNSGSTFSLQSSFNTARGLLLLRPVGLVSSSLNKNSSPLPISTLVAGGSNLPATIEGLSFNGYGQLIIQANRAINYQSSLNPANNTYSFTLPSIRISPQLRRPILAANSPIEQIRLNQVGNAVVITIKTITGWQIRDTARTNLQVIALQLISVGQVAANPVQNPRAQLLQTYASNNANNYANSNIRPLVLIDPGHGGQDVGATRNGVYEKDIVLSMSKHLGRILQQMGYSVAYTRTEDIDLDLEPRVKMAENARASAFVSVHVNSLNASASQVSGVETYHAPSASLGKNLAEFVHKQIIASTGANDRGVRSARFHVILKTSMPAILVETGFITNPSEASRLLNSAYQERMAEAIAKGVDQFLRSYRK